MSEGNYRLKREVITDFMKERMPTLCEVEKPLNWWLENRIVPNDEDLEPCEGIKADASTEPSINYDGVLADSVCYYTPCLDQYKDKCTCGSAWKTCDNRQTDR